MLASILVLCGVFALACFLLARSHAQQQAVWAAWHREVLRERESWRDERRELLNRIQRPQLVTPQPVESFELPEPEPDESSAVGTIVWDDRYAEQDPDMPMPETVEID